MVFRSARGFVPILALLITPALFGACGDDDDDEFDIDGTLPREVQLTKADNGKTAEVGLGETLVVALPSNPSTGFSWSVTAPEPGNVELLGEPTYIPPGSTSPVVGAAGTQVFTFRPLKAGTDTLTMGYARSFEPGVAPAETFSVTITVK